MNYEEIVLDAFRKINARAGHVVPIRNFRNGISAPAGASNRNK